MTTWAWKDVVWYNVAVLAAWHAGAVYGMYRGVQESSWALWGGFLLLWAYSGLGITAGAHRLWSHKAYKASLPVRAFLGLGNSMAFQGSIFEWSRDHRVHHKASDTDGDPYNAERGFWFSHVGWVMLRKLPKVKEIGAKIDCSDLLADPVVALQKKFYVPSVLLMCYAVPAALGHWWLGDAWLGFLVLGVARHVWVLNVTWLVNSAAHMWGMQTYSPKPPRENWWVSLLTHGEGFHSFHHAYPYDYAAGEWGIDSGAWNPTKLFIDALAKVGLVHSRKRVQFVTKKEEAARKAAASAAPATGVKGLFQDLAFGGRSGFMS